MAITKRELIMGGPCAAAAAAAGASLLSGTAAAAPAPLPSVMAAKPIGKEERAARLAKVQGLMRGSGVGMLVLEPGAAMTYFTGLRWWRSERPTLALVFPEGDVGIVTPFFERPSVEETVGVPAEVRTWHENEDPFAVAAGLARDRKAKGKAAMEESVRFFVADGIAGALPALKPVPGAPLTRACRMIKTPAELALMRAATDVTIAAYRDVYEGIEPGMSAAEVSAMMDAATRKYGGSPTFSMVLLNEASAYPHGTDQPQTVKEGGIVLMDCGCDVNGYKSDVSRTFVLGEATKRQREVWKTVRRGQEIGLEHALPGTPAGAVDKAVRDYYEGLGWGPGYRVPGLSHRLGHGIGMEGHEPINLVQDETTPLAPGMCFSDEPGLYEFGAFGVRLEDCFVVTEAGPALFSALQPSIERPV